jgi:hypothetical protein
LILDPVLDFFRGQAITTPPLDGAFRANTILDDVPVFSELVGADNLALVDDRVIVSSGKVLYTLGDNGGVKELQRYPQEITAIAVSTTNQLALAFENGDLSIAGQPVSLPSHVKCITALSFAADGSLWLANGSSTHPTSAWVVDLMEKNASGSLWKCAAGSQSFREIAEGLAYPYGLLADNNGVVVSESWRHRLIRIDGESGARKTIVSQIPGYPARLSRARDDGAWLSVFAPRNRLVELVLQETHYRFDMMASVPRDYWIAPALSSGRSFLEPLQCGGMKVMGIHKPWAPSRSYGMVVRLDSSMTPTSSFHSRANGSRHGTCSAIERDKRLFVAARGDDCILAVDVSENGEC